MIAEGVRVEVYRSFAHQGTPPTTAELAAALNTTPEQVDTALRQLADARHLVIDGAGQIIMAHPFSAVPLGFSVMGRETLWWGGCCWDSFAMPRLLDWEESLLVATRCPNCAAPHAWSVTREAPPPGEQVAHFLVPSAHMWDDVVHTCRHQRIFCNENCVDQWLARTGHTRGYVMNLATLWRFASGWYTGRLDPNYLRREPSDAAAYLRSVGLKGEFWGL